MTQEFVTLPREVVEQALESLLNEGNFRKLRKPLIEESIKQIKAALEQPQNHVPDVGNMVPAGWKLVPMEPTQAMLYDIQEYSHILPPRGKRIWAHMLAAAPQPPALEQQVEQEPVAVVDFTTGGWRKIVDAMRTLPDGAQLYTHPQARREPLTHYEIHELFRRSWDDCQDGDEIKAFARAIEAAHGIKEPPAPAMGLF